MLMLWMCSLSFAQEEKNELGLLLGGEFIPRAATTCKQKLSVGRIIAYSVDYARRLSSGNTALLLEFPFVTGPSHRVESAQLNAITSLAMLFVTPSLRAQFVSHAPASLAIRGPRIWTLQGKRVLQNGVANPRFIGTWRQRNSAGESTSAPGSNCCSPSASEASFGTSTRQGTPVSAFRLSAQNSIISYSREDWSSTLSRLRRGDPLVNMEDRMLDRFADHQS